MSAIGQRRTASAAAIMMLFAVLQFVLFAVNPAPANAADPEPTYGSAVVDGNIGEWDLTADHFAHMIKAGGQGGQTEVLGHAYLRYDCDTSNLYVLALSTGDYDGLAESWVKIYELGNSEANGTEAVVYEGETAVGFETVVTGLDPGNYTIEVHFNNDGDTASNVKGGGPLTIECDDTPPPPGDADVNVSNRCVDGRDTVTYTVSNATIKWTVNGSPATVASGDSFAEGDVVAWVALENDGYEFGDDGDTVEGKFEAEKCDEEPPPPGDADVMVKYGCDDKLDFRVHYTVSNATIVWTVNGVSGAVVTDGQSFAEGTQVSWTTTPKDGYVFGDDGDTVEGKFVAEKCDEEPPPPGDADVTVSHQCSNGVYVVTFSVSNGSIVWTVNGSPATVVSGQSFAEGDDVEWAASADKGYVFDADDHVKGAFEAEKCDEEPPTTNPTTPVTRTSDTGTIIIRKVAVDATSSDAFVFTRDFGTARFVLGNGGANTVGGLSAGVYTVTENNGAGWFLTKVECTDGSKSTIADTGLSGLVNIDLSAGETVTCTFTNETVEVLGIQIEPTTTTTSVGTTVTTIEPVTVGTLPFTGFESEDAVKLALVILAAGTVLVLSIGRRDEDLVTDDSPVKGWKNN